MMAVQGVPAAKVSNLARKDIIDMSVVDRYKDVA